MRRTGLPIVVFLSALLAGCGSTPPTRYFLLESVVAPSGSASGPRIGISELEVSQYLLAPQLQQRSAPNVLERASFERWAEP
ncbi:MAG: membrane integrity-associated transporter subunit PqiC, partial [Gammaproteobacteria bacterium]